MGSNKFACVALSAVVVAIALLHPCNAQNSPSDYLYWHNYFRAQVGVPALALDDRLQAYADNRAREVAASCTLQHNGGHYGENLAMGSDNAVAVLSMWVNEYRYYDPSTNTCQADQTCGHYTQVVWRSTQRVGCGASYCADGTAVVVCNYDPPGNMEGEGPFQ